ncbi:MAG TPA: general secretion pathway protein GspF [Gammaproteobacteria bacterium]|nr:general secretion pathway protein GspF [Gammaproteobacteria bacterium]
MAKRKQALHPDAPLRHRDHARPVTRRDFLAQGFISGMGMTMGGSVLSMLAGLRTAAAAEHPPLSPDIEALASLLLDANGDKSCSLGGTGNNPLPFICFDLAGGANIAGSNVLVGRDTQMDFLSTAGYSKLGLPGDMIPGLVDPSGAGNGDFTDTSFGLAFHSDSAFLRGMLVSAPTVAAAAGNVDGVVIPARSGNDTGNNPHNPMYGIAKAGGDGKVVSLIGSRNSDSGGNSLAPAMMIDPTIRPTKVDRPSDVTGMVDTGGLTDILSDPQDVVSVMESVARISYGKLGKVNTGLANDTVVKDLVRCGYLKAADLTSRFAGVSVDPATDPNIVGNIFTADEFANDREFQKTASVMKMVIDGNAGAGTIAMGGYDYHTGDRATGERRDLRAGRCIGACLEYAAIRNTPVMIYVFSDGSLASNGTLDNSTDGRGKGVWTGDNSSTAASFILVYNPRGVTALRSQIGAFSADGSVITSSSPAANNVNLLVETVILNYMSMTGQIGQFASLFNGFGPNPSAVLLDSLTAFGPLTLA